jgi:hypothetical protein
MYSKNMRHPAFLRVVILRQYPLSTGLYTEKTIPMQSPQIHATVKLRSLKITKIFQYPKDSKMKKSLLIYIIIEAIVIIPFISFLTPVLLATEIGDRATWASSIISFFTMIFTAVIGFYAYNIAKEQNKTSQIAYMAEMLWGLAERCNEASARAQIEHSRSGDGQNIPQIEQALSDLATATIKSREIINKLHPNDFIMYRIMFYSMINSSVSTEIMGKKILNHYSLPQYSNINRQYEDAKIMVEPAT